MLHFNATAFSKCTKTVGSFSIEYVFTIFKQIQISELMSLRPSVAVDTHVIISEPCNFFCIYMTKIAFCSGIESNHSDEPLQVWEMVLSQTLQCNIS